MNDEAELTLRIAEGDRAAFLNLYDRYSARVYGLAFRMLGEAMAAEEVAQDTFLKLWTRAETYRPDRGTFLAWLLTIAKRAALDRIRREDRRPPTTGADAGEILHYVPDPESTPQEARWSTMRFLVEALPDDQRRAIELAYYHGLSQSQIAEFLDIPLGTVKTRIRLGMKKLREAWIHNGVDSTDANTSKTDA